MHILIDLTRPHKGTEEYILDRFLSTQDLVSSDVVECYLSHSQTAPSLRPQLNAVRLTGPIDDTSVAVCMHKK